MEKIKGWIEAIRAGEDPRKLATWKEEADITLCFVSPRMDEIGWIKMILPAYFLGTEQAGIRTLVTAIEDTQTVSGLRYEDLEIQIDPGYVAVSDAIIFPFIANNLTGVYEKIRAINPKITIFFHIDFPFFKDDGPISRQTRGADIYSPIGQQAITANVLFADIILS